MFWLHCTIAIVLFSHLIYLPLLCFNTCWSKITVISSNTILKAVENVWLSFSCQYVLCKPAALYTKKKCVKCKLVSFRKPQTSKIPKLNGYRSVTRLTSKRLLLTALVWLFFLVVFLIHLTLTFLEFFFMIPLINSDLCRFYELLAAVTSTYIELRDRESSVMCIQVLQDLNILIETGRVVVRLFFVVLLIQPWANPGYIWRPTWSTSDCNSINSSTGLHLQDIIYKIIWQRIYGLDSDNARPCGHC